jgi:putative ABC transport system permease protein
VGKVTLKGILAHKVRFLLTGVAVILGVAFISGTLVLSETINNTFTNLFSNVYEKTDAVVRAPEKFSGDFGAVRGRISADLIPQVRRAEGVAQADGNISSFAYVVDRDNEALNKDAQGPPALGFGWMRSRDLSPFHLVNVQGQRPSRPPSAPDEIVIDKNTADKAGYRVGAKGVPVITQSGRAEYTLVGLAGFGDADSLLGATTVLFTPPTASRVFGAPGQVDEIDAKADPGVSEDELVRNIRRELGDQRDLEVLTGEEITKETQDDIEQNLSFIRNFLLAFGVIALLVGSFIIFNTFSIIVAQRTREMALLRAIGARSAQVIRSVLFEALLVGVVASVIGFVGGILLAGALKAALAALGVDIPASDIAIPASAPIASFVVGILVTVVAAVFPALRAARIPPIAALQRVGADQSPGTWRRVVAGIVVTALGLALLLSGLFGGGDNPLPAIILGALIVFVGIAILGPLIARPISGVLGWPIRGVKGITGLLAEENAKRNPKRTSATAAALMIGVALVGMIIVFGASARASIRKGIDESMKADYIVTSGGFGFGTLPRSLEGQLAETPGVEEASGTQFGQIKVEGGVSNTLGVDPALVDSLFDLKVSDGSIRDLGTNGIAVQKSKAEDEKWQVGDDLTVQFPQGDPKNFTIRAVYDQDSVPQIPEYTISTEAYVANFPIVFDTNIYLLTRGGPNPANRAAIEKTMDEFPNGKLQDRDEFKQAQSQQINQFLNLIYALLLFAIFIALFGIANTLGLSIIERTRELGLMRAVGMTRRQVRSLIRWEAVIVALLGAFLGIVVGLFFGWALVTALSSEGLDTFRAGPVQLVVVFVLAALFGVLAAIWPARRAAKLDVLQAISTE